MAKFFFVLSRILFASMLVMALLSPASAQENEPETTCVDQENEDNTACTVHVNDYNDSPIVYMTVEEDQTAVEIITYTSLTCDDHETGEGTDTYAADPYLKLYDSDGTIIGEDDDSAAHNVNGMCWDSYLTLTLDSGDYELLATSYSNATIGTYTLEFFGVSWSLSNDPEPAPDPEPTPTPDNSVPDEEVEPTPEPVEPTPQPDPTPEVTPTPEEEIEPPVDNPIQDPTPLPPEPEVTPEPDPPWEPPIRQPSPPPVLILPSPIGENLQIPVTTDIEGLEEEPFEDDIMWDFDDVEWEEFELDELPEIEFIAEEFEEEEEEETTFFDDGEQEQPDEVQSDVELEEEFVLEEYEDIEEVDFEELDADELDDEILIEILQDEETVEVFFEEVLEDNPDFFEEATDEQITVIFESAPEIFNEASDEVKEELEEEINVFAGGFEEYVPEDSNISVDDRRSIIAVTSATTIVAGAAIARPTPPPTPRPVQPAPTRPSSPQSASPSGPETPRRKTRDDKA